MINSVALLAPSEKVGRYALQAKLPSPDGDPPQNFWVVFPLCVVKFTRHITGPAAKLRYNCCIFFYIKGAKI